MGDIASKNSDKKAEEPQESIKFNKENEEKRANPLL